MDERVNEHSFSRREPLEEHLGVQKDHTSILE